MFKKTALVAGIALAVSAAAQADYRWEANAAAGVANYDWDRDDGDVDSFGIGGTFFLDSVDTSKGPQGEAAFLDHASNVSLSYVYTDADDIIKDFDGDQYKADGRYVTDSAGWIFDASYQRNEPNNAQVDTYTLGLGKYLTEATTLVITYADADVDNGGDTDGWQASMEHLWSWSDGGVKLEGNAGFINVDHGDDIDVYNIAATWYITNNVGLGLAAGYTDFANQEVLSTDIFAEWFITDAIAVSALVGYAETEDDIDFGTHRAELERSRAVIGATYRF